MKSNSKRIVSKIGLGSAILTFLFGMCYIIALFATLSGLLKSPWDMTFQNFIINIFSSFIFSSYDINS